MEYFGCKLLPNEHAKSSRRLELILFIVASRESKQQGEIKKRGTKKKKLVKGKPRALD